MLGGYTVFMSVRPLVRTHVRALVGHPIVGYFAIYSFSVLKVANKNKGTSWVFEGLFSSFLTFLYPQHLCPGVYSFRLSVHPFARLFICSSVRDSIHLWNYFKVLRQSFSSGVYLTNHSSESIPLWTIGTLEGQLSFHDSWPQGPCPGMGLEVKI